jgi:hypothetical protein
MSVLNMRDELERLAYEVRYNTSQKESVAFVCSILREPVLHVTDRDDLIDSALYLRLQNQCRPPYRYFTPRLPFHTHIREDEAYEDPFYLRMQTCIHNCDTKLSNLWHYNPHFPRPADLDFNDLFRLLMGTVDIPLAPETAALLGDADRVLIGRNAFKRVLGRHVEWKPILRQIASVAVRDAAICEQVCASVEGYTTEKLQTERQALKAAETHAQVEAGVDLGIHREQQLPSPDTTTLESLMHRMLEF